MDAVLGDKPATRPQVIVDTLETVTEMSQDPEGGSEVRTSVTTNPILACSEECHQEQALSYFDSSQDHSSQPSSSASIASTPTLEKKGKKRNREGQLERAMINVVDHIVSAQKASDVKKFELEEERMRFEERLLEREECEKKERREFQKHMLGMRMQGIHPPMQGPQLLPNLSTSFQSNQYGNPQCNY